MQMQRQRNNQYLVSHSNLYLSESEAGNNTKALKAESIFYISTSAGLDQAFVKTFFHIIVYVSRLDFLIDNFDNAGNPDLSVMQRSTFPDSINSINSTLREEKVLPGPSPVCQVEIEN